MKLIGLTDSQAEESRRKHGDNSLTEIPPESLFRKILNGFKDPMIMILLVALVIQVVLFFMNQAEWFEPVGILIAIIIANGVSSVSEKKQEGKASVLRAEEESKEMTKVLRSGKLREIHIKDIVVGDIVYLQAGDKIPADGVIVHGSVKVDQAALNGETEEALKIAMSEGECYDKKDLLNSYYAYRGTVVCNGEAYMKIEAVGDKTLFGELALEVQEETRKTPLQVKLGKLAKQISTFGYVGAICIVSGIMIRSLATGGLPEDVYGWISLIIDAVTVAVTIIVCAVPEGLPMLTSILLSFQSLKMAKDNVLVRKINGLETAGSINILFCDKTGTITDGKLSVVEVVTADRESIYGLNAVDDDLRKDIIYGTGINNSSVISDDSIIGGNSTDRALMQYLKNQCEAAIVNKDCVRSFEAFDSNKKISSVTIEENGRAFTYIKGAPERIIERCDSYIDKDGQKRCLENREKLNAYMDEQSRRSMRLLAVAKCSGNGQDEGFTLICIISIRDNVRKEAASAIRDVREAGIQVIMVTGDRKETAVAIARESGLITSENDIILTSQEMAEKTDEELKVLLPVLRVVARALPADKSRLVRISQELDYVVGMTGDGVNDSPALKKADVGFAMGSGTEVAKEAGDITILDDNFSSIEKAILYGRTMFKSIRKFLIFQLTVNVAAVLICFIGPLCGENVILTVIQLLAVNLTMDTLAAIAFGSEPALMEFMKEKPIRRTESIITKDMLMQIIIGALYLTAICLGILFFQPIRELFGDADKTYLKSAVFATFMMGITLNGFNARTERINPFEGIGRNKSFLLVTLSIFVLQFIFINFGGSILEVERLTAGSWLICFGFAFLIIPIGVIRKVVSKALHSKRKA